MRLRGRNGDPHPRIQQVIEQTLRGIARPRVLEAGCGSMSRITLGANWTLVGIDISVRQLERNTSLTEKIHGDLQSHCWQPPGFDLIVCWDVVEHLHDPRAALRNLAAALAPGGAMVLAFPNYWSLKGFVTRLTPFRLHAWFYQHVLGDRRRLGDLDQFPTLFRHAIAPGRLRSLMRQLGLDVVFDEIYEGPVQSHMRRVSRLADFGFGALAFTSHLLTLGSLDLGLSDCILIVRRPPVERNGRDGP